MNLQLSKRTEARLDRLARRTGIAKADHVRQAILRLLDEVEEMHEAEKVLARVRSGKEKTYSFDDVVKRLRL